MPEVEPSVLRKVRSHLTHEGLSATHLFPEHLAPTIAQGIQMAEDIPELLEQVEDIQVVEEEGHTQQEAGAAHTMSDSHDDGENQEQVQITDTPSRNTKLSCK